MAERDDGIYRELIRRELRKRSEENEAFKNDLIERLVENAKGDPIDFSAGKILLHFFLEDVKAKRELNPKLVLFVARSFALILDGIEPKKALGLVRKKSGNPNKQRKPKLEGVLWDRYAPKPKCCLVEEEPHNHAVIRGLVDDLMNREGGKKSAMKIVAKESGYSYRQVQNICRDIKPIGN